MRKAFFAVFLLMVLFCCVSCGLDFMDYFSTDLSSVRMLAIGMDYANSKAASFLSGTMNDVYDMAAVFNEIMAVKNVKMETEYLVQEGYDVLLEVRCYQNAKTNAEKIEEKLKTASPAPTSVEKSGNTVRAFVESETLAESIKTSLEAEYGSHIKVSYASTRESSHYPSRQNIMKGVQNAAELGETDLFIVYYTGHGISLNVIPDDDFSAILEPYRLSGGITQDQYDTLMNVSIKNDTQVLAVISKMNIDSGIYSDICSEFSTYLKSHTNLRGSLITAPYYSWEYYDLLDMETVYRELSKLKCKVVLIVDACYSGFANAGTFSGVSVSESFSTFMQSTSYPNVVVLSASAKDETSKISIAVTEEKDTQRHSMFTIKLLSKLEWKHSAHRTTYLSVPAAIIGDDGKLAGTETKVREIEGYLSKVPLRMTATELFDKAMGSWSGIEQTPERNTSGYEICIVP